MILPSADGLGKQKESQAKVKLDVTQASSSKAIDTCWSSSIFPMFENLTFV